MGFKDYRRYDGRIIADSFNRTASLFIENWGKSAVVVLSGAIFAAVRIGILYVIGETVQVAEELVWVLSGAITLVILGVIVFAWNIATGPYRLWKRDQEVINQKNKELDLLRNAYEQPLVTFSHSTSLLPISVPTSRSVWVLYLCPQNNPNLSEQHFPEGMSVIDWGKLENDYAYSCECRIKNYSDSPLFRLNIPIIVKFYTAIIEIEEDGTKVTQTGDMVSSYEWDLEFHGTFLDSKNEFCFWIYNPSKHIVMVEFPDHINLQINNDAQRGAVPLVHTSAIRSTSFSANK